MKAKEATREAIVKIEKKKQAQMKRERSAGVRGRSVVEEAEELEDLDDEDEKERDEEDIEREGYWQRSGKRVKV